MRERQRRPFIKERVRKVGSNAKVAKLPTAFRGAPLQRAGQPHTERQERERQRRRQPRYGTAALRQHSLKS